MAVSHLTRGILLAASLYAILIGSIGLKSLDMHSVVDEGTFFPPALAKIATDEARKGAAVNLAATVQIDRMGHTSSLNTPAAKETPTQLQKPMIPTQEADTKNRIILPLPFDPEAALRRTERNTTRWINSTNHTIFYNIFVSPLIKGGDTFMDEDGRRKAGLSNIRNVIGNQVREIQNSSLRDATVYFNLFGKEYDDPSFWCPPELDCRLMKHQPVGQEVDTLQDLHDFCVDNPSKRVTYLHNKGSLSLSAGNVVVRRLSNRAVFSDACLSMPLSDEYPCNICALKYSFSPHLHAAGNVWMADCSYVRKLVPPVEWEQRRRHMYQLLALPYHKEFGCLTNTILAGHFDGGGNFNESAGSSTAQGLGLGRYAFETWILSHPDAIPCQSLHGAITRKAYDKTWRPVLRDAINVRLQFHGQQKDSWFQKAGRLWEMKYHYGFKPPRNNPFFYGTCKVLCSFVLVRVSLLIDFVYITHFTESEL
jgi:hypothetical protein